MTGKKLWIAAGCILLSAALAVGGFFLGRETEASRNREAQELNYRLHRSDLEGLEAFEGTIYVTGHQIPDSDTVAGSIAYADLLRKLGYDAVPVILSPINTETAWLLQTAGVEVPELLEDASGRNMVLVDHSDYAQSAEGLANARILAVIDHHGVGSVTSALPLIYDARPIGAATTIIWMRYRDCGFEPDRQTACAMLGAILSDTSNFKSASTTFADREAVAALSALAGVTDTDAIYANLYKASISYEGMTDEEILLSDYRQYGGAGRKYGIGVVSVYDESEVKEMIARMLNAFPKVAGSDGMDMAFAQISIFHDDLSITYLVPSNQAAEEVLRAAYPASDRVTYDGNVCRLEPGISRKRDLVPAITAVLEAVPTE